MKKYLPYLKKFFSKYKDVIFWGFLTISFCLSVPSLFPDGFPDINDPQLDQAFKWGCLSAFALGLNFNLVYSIFCLFQRNSPPSGEDK